MNGTPSPSDFWAKLKYKNNERSTGEIVAWNPLLAHSADVAAVTEVLLQRTILRERLATLVGWDELSDVHVARLSALAAIHDAGKVNQGFQNRAFGEKPTADHVSPIVSIFEADRPVEYLESLNVIELLDWFPDGHGQEAVYRFLLATWGHHGQPVKPQSFNPLLWEASGARDPLEGLEELVSYARKWFPSAFSGEARPFPIDPPLQHAFNGVLTLADWIGSDADLFDFADSREDPMPRARKQAREAVEQLFLDPQPARQSMSSDAGFDHILEDPSWDPYPIQQAVRDVPIRENGGLVVLESDTGSGKTEAALARFVRLFQVGRVDGMYFAVPTRTAAQQLHERVREAAKRLFPENARPPVVQAVPGYIKADDVEATRLPGFEVRWDDAIEHRGWAAESSKRYLAGPIVVGTVDQALLSALQASHAHMRAAALMRHFLVVDEVHASDAYMTRLMDRVLGQHLAAGGHALLMSATLGASARVHLTTGGRASVPCLEEAVGQDYPFVTYARAARQEPEHVHAASSGKSKTVEPDVRPLAGDAQAVAELALENAWQGARVLVIRNLVDDCMAVQRALEDRAGRDTALLFGVNETPAPHHSRFAPDDRQELDRAIEETFGKDALERGVVAVATQTVEQSLDLDADLMITDLCPMDVLLQRIGRLHRHSRARPDGFETARCVVLTPEERDLTPAITGDGSAIKGQHGHGTVYDDLRVIEATWQVLEDDALAPWQIPEDNRQLVERATHPEPLRTIVEDGGDAWDQHEQWVLGARQADLQAAGYVELDRSQHFGEELFPDDLQKVRTRLGQDDHRILLPEPILGPFGKTIGELSVSEWQLGEPPETEEASDVTAFEGGFRFAFSGETFQYDRFGLAVD